MAVSCFISLVAFSGVSRSASASATTKTLTPAETRALIGDTIPAKYFNGSQYVDFDFQYSSTWSISSVSCADSCLPSAGQTVLIYSQSGSISVGGSNSYIQVDLQPEYSFYDTEVIRQFIGVSSGSSVSIAAYQSPAWRWFVSSQGDKAFYNDSETSSGSGAQSCFYVGFDSSMPFTFVDADYTSQSTFSAYSYRALFYGNSAKNGHLYLAVSCPVISDTSTMASGTGGVTTAVTGGSGDITVNVDMTETNTFLGGILDFLEGLLQGIASLFVPSHDDFLEWLDDLHNLLREHFGAFVDTMLIIDSVFDSIPSNPEEELYIQLPYDVAVSGVPMVFTMQDWTFPLVPTGWAWLVDMLKDFCDILVTIAFINMVRNRWEHFLDPDSPET